MKERWCRHRAIQKKGAPNRRLRKAKVRKRGDREGKRELIDEEEDFDFTLERQPGNGLSKEIGETGSDQGNSRKKIRVCMFLPDRLGLSPTRRRVQKRGKIPREGATKVPINILKRNWLEGKGRITFGNENTGERAPVEERSNYI